MSQSQNKFTSVLAGTMVLFFFQSAHADLGSTIKISKMATMKSTAMDAIGTGSTGSYSHNEKKAAEDRNKSYAHGKSHHGSKKTHAYSHNRSEGSRSKSYAHGKKHHGSKKTHAYSHNRSEESRSKSYAHGKSHHGSKKSHVYSHNRSEGSRSKSYAHGKSHHGSKKSHVYSHNRSEGSRSKSYAHGKNHHGSKKSHVYSHNRSEGSRSKSYAHGKNHHGNKRASTHGRHGSYRSSPFKHVMHYKYKLGLTDAQITTMKKLDVDFKKKIIQAKADHEKAHLELDLQVHSGKVNEAKIRAAGEKIVASKTGKIMAMIEAKIQLLNLLNAEQRTKMAKMH